MIRIDLFSDIICPWCFIGKRRLECAMAERPETLVEIHWRAFQLNPDMPKAGMSRQEYLAMKFGDSGRARHVYSMIGNAGARVGLQFKFDSIERTPNTVAAHRLIAWATATQEADELVEALFIAYFLEGRDIGRVEVLAEIAEDAGLDGAAARRFLDTDGGLQAVAAETRFAYQNGITGVPCFIINQRYAVSGAQEPEAFFPLFDLCRVGEAAEAAD